MSFHFGFSYVGLIFLLLLLIPNLLWTKRQPEGYETFAGHENHFLLALERIGEALVTVTALIFTDFNLRALTWWSLWLLAAAFWMLLYEIYWIRYFRSPKTMRDFYSSLLGVPVAGATLPVAAFFCLAVYGKNLWLLLAVVVLGIGHIGIHWNHFRELPEE